ncbi:uncharacterized protein LOC116337000 [Contarinia nasturtii]|uniref:uncharacterized protein LOC116337000 n=1 Tax=Contarinia nasturtii TaxID=265458 RepID=UPI0012D3A37E|nr:uncharacterized protein LOC116337000 [Contarinia nasturtii]
MSNLWTKEHRKGFPLYVDLFEDLPLIYEKEFTKWNKQLDESQWKHVFLGNEYEPVKSNETAHQLNVIAIESFQFKDFRKSYELFNQALRFIDKKSPQMGVIFLKRAQCFFNMNMYEQCSADAYLARESNFPNNFLSDLDEYHNNCFEFIKQNERKAQTIKLSIDADKEYPCMANVVKIIKNDIHGMEVVATSDIDIGQTILVEEAFTSISNSFDTTTCFTCQKTCANFIPCERCVDVMFCSIECMGGSEIHKISCGEVYHRMPSYTKFVLQSILKAVVTFPSIDLLIKFVKAKILMQTVDMVMDAKMKNYELFFELTTSNQELPILLIHQVYTTLMKMTLIADLFSTKTKQRFLMHLVAHHAQVLLCNSYGGFEKEQNQQITATMTNVASFFEHSCTPNLMQFSIGNRTVLITNQFIKAGDHLYIDYWPEDEGGNNESTESRAILLQKNFNVSCKCRKCNPNKKALIIADPYMVSHPAYRWVLDYKKHMGSDTSALMKQQCINFLKEYKHASWSKEKDYIIKTYTECVLNEFDGTNPIHFK